MTYSRQFLYRLFAGLLVLIAASNVSFAGDAGRDRTQVGHSISIAPGEEVTDATCFGCSIRVRGHVAGDVTAFGGSVVVEDQGNIGGDATVFGGDIRLDQAVSVRGDVTVFGGRVRRDPQASVGGDVTNMGGPGWVFLIFLAPFLFLGMFVAAIVWLIRRLLRPAIPLAA